MILGHGIGVMFQRFLRVAGEIIPGMGAFFSNDSTTNRYYTDDALNDPYFTQDQS